MATNMGKRIIYRTRREVAEMALGNALGFLGNNPDKNAQYFIKAIDHIASGEKQSITRDWVYTWLAPGKPGKRR